MSDKIIRAAEAMNMLGLRQTAFVENFVRTGRLRKIRVTGKADGNLLSEVEALVAELAEHRLPAHGVRPTTGKPRSGRYSGRAA